MGLSEKGEEIKQNKTQQKILIDPDNGMEITRGEGGQGR